MQYRLALALCLAACGDDDGVTPPRDAGFDARVRDAGSPRTDAGSRDGGADTGFDGGSDAGTDAGVADAGCTADSCEEGFACTAGACVPVFDCCREKRDCPTAYFCDPKSCRCAIPPGCCSDPTLCGPTEECTRACRCERRAVCDPPCEAHQICERGGLCVARCEREGCSDADEVCTTDGCRVPACTDDECLLLTTPYVCDPAVGCIDVCAEPGVGERCTAIGAECVVGNCIDRTCAAVGSACGYRMDCCGDYWCIPATAPDPVCPTECPPPSSPPLRADLCLCTPEGSCAGIGGAGRPLPP